MAFTTAPKRGKKGKNPGTEHKVQNSDLPTMYSAAEFGGGRPGTERRFTNIYGKNAKARSETDVEAGQESRRTGRMFNWMKGESY
jgi:hypothetical protein